MADFSALISQIQADIKTNLNQEITGAILQQDLLAMVNLINQLKQDTLAGYSFYGAALSNGDSVNVTQNTFFLAGAGTYTINGTSVTISTEGISVIVYDSTTTTITNAVIVEYDNTPTQSSTKPVTSGGVYTAIDTLQTTKQDVLSFDDAPTQNSSNPVKSGGVKSALDSLSITLGDAIYYKQARDTDAVSGNFAVFDADGNTIDAGIAPTDKQDVAKAEANASQYVVISGIGLDGYRIDMTWYTDLADISQRSGSLVVSCNSTPASCVAYYYGDDMGATDGGAPFASVGFYDDNNGNYALIIGVDSNVYPEDFSIYNLNGNLPTASVEDDISSYSLLADADITDITGTDKQDKDTDAVNGNVAKFDANGNSVDAGYAADNVALQDGSYPNLVAGSAENLVGRGSVAAEYTFRTSGGTDDIGTGTAVIKSMKGKSIVWNQLIAPRAFGNITGDEGWGNISLTKNADGSYEVVVTETLTVRAWFVLYGTYNGHKCYWNTHPSANAAAENSIVTTFKNISAHEGIKDTTSGNTSYYIFFNIGTPAGIYTFRPQLFDLTLMFGSGNEPTTVDDFKALYYLPYYDANDGVIVSNTATGIKTIGFNQWDEEWVNGTLDATTGATATGVGVRCKNFIPAFPSTDYYFRLVGYDGKLCFYDAGKNFISAIDGTRGAFTTPAGCRFIKFAAYTSYGTTYRHDICINLSWSGYRNGEYEPYWESLLSLNLKTITGIPAGGSVSETIFPDGLRGVGSAYDELVVDADGWARKAIKRFASVDLGSLDWGYNTYAGVNYFFTTSPLQDVIAHSLGDNVGIAGGGYMVIPTTGVSQLTSNMLLDIGTDKNIYITNSSYSDAATFKTAMSGVELVYALAAPVEYTLDTPIYMGYRVDDFGTEQRLPADTESAVTAPISYDVQYAMNAVDTLRRLPVNYLSKESTENLLTALQTAGIISAYTMTYNSTSEEYEFTITQ